MATRMQQRRGTAAQWTSSNPVLEAGEIGWESDTNKFKIGDSATAWASLDYFVDVDYITTTFSTSLAGTYLELSDLGTASGPAALDSTFNVLTKTGVVFEGATADAHETTLTVTDPTADRTVTFQDATGTVVLRDSTDTLTNKSISLGSNTVTSTLAQLNTAVSDADVASLAGSETLTNKTIAIGSNTVSGTIAQFNTAVTDADFATLAGSETLTNKTIAIGSNTVSGTIAQFNTAVTDADFATLAGTETFTNKTLTSPAINTPTGITKSDVGLANVDNTTDANKPISTATQSALDLKAPLASPTFTGTVSAADLTLSGDLTVNGTTTTLNSTTLTIDDKNIILGDVVTPSDVTADGGGLTLKGATDKTLNWVDATDAWTSSEHVNLASGKSLYLNGTLLKDVTETLTNKTLTSPTINTATVTTPSAASIPLITKGAASQTASLQEWQNSGGSAVASVDVNGRGSFTNLRSSTATSILTVTSAASVVLNVKGAASQTASLQEWQNSTGTGLAKVDASGVVSTSAGVYSPYYQGNNGVGGTIAFANATAITITPQSASVQPLIVKGAASQTASLQEWQNSAGTLLTKIGSDGLFKSFNGVQLARTFFLPDGATDATGYSYAYFNTTSAGQGIQAKNLTPTVTPFTIVGYASQTASLMEWQNSTGTVLAKVTSTGDITAPSATLNGSISGTTQILSGATAGTSVLTLPVATDTLVGKATTDTLTNKTLTAPLINTAFNAQTGTTYTLVAADSSKLVSLSNAAAITLTLPISIFAAGEQINIIAIGAGQVTLAATAGATIVSTGATAAAPKLRVQYSAATIICQTGGATPTFYVVGDLS